MGNYTAIPLTKAVPGVHVDYIQMGRWRSQSASQTVRTCRANTPLAQRFVVSHLVIRWSRGRLCSWRWSTGASSAVKRRSSACSEGTAATAAVDASPTDTSGATWVLFAASADNPCHGYGGFILRS